MICRPITYIQIALALVVTASSFQAHGVLLTFDEPGTVNGNSAETFYAAQGVLFSGGGLLVDGAAGGEPGQPNFAAGRIGTVRKVQGPVYEDSFFDIWIHFTGGGVTDVSGDYYGNLGFGGTVEAYDAAGSLLDSFVFAALEAPGTFNSGVLTSFALGGFGSGIAKVHLISEDARAGSFLDNLEFSPVPVPAALWLFATAIVGLIGFGRPGQSLTK